MLMLRAKLTIACLLVLSACTTTPDLAGWSQNSADLAGAVAAENKAVLTRIESNIVQLEIGEQEGWNLGTEAAAHSSKNWKQYYQEYAQATEVINSTLDVMVLYANALAELAAKGETGKEAGTTILESFEEILQTVGKSVPFGGAASESLKVVSDIVTKVQAQNSLAKTMTQLQPAVDQLATSITKYAEVQKRIIGNIEGLEGTLIDEAAGPNRMAWYVQNKGFKQNEEAFEGDVELADVVAVSYLRSEFEVRYRHRQEQRAERQQWTRNRLSALSKITKAAEAWQRSHKTAAEILRECGGLRSLRASCGNYSAANLKLAAERIRTVYEAEK